MFNHQQDTISKVALRCFFFFCLAILLALSACTTPEPKKESSVHSEKIADQVRSESRLEPSSEPSPSEQYKTDASSEKGSEPSTPDTSPMDRKPPEQTPEPSRETTPDAPVLSKKHQAVLKAAEGEFKKQKLVGLGIALVKSGQIVLSKGWGWADRENKIPVQPAKTLFRWASISKTLAGVVAVQLSQEKKLDLNQNIEMLLKGYKAPSDWVAPCKAGQTRNYRNKTYTCKSGLYTFPLEPSERVLTSAQLLSHQGGIAHYTNGKGNPTPPSSKANDPKTNTGLLWAVQGYLYNKPLVAIPGTKYSYTTFGFNLLGVVLESASSTSFADLVQQRISVPAKATTLQPDYEWKTIPNRAVGYYRSSTSGNIFRQGSSDVSWKLPGGGFLSSVEDLGRYCGALHDESLLSDAAKKLAWTRQKLKNGNSTSYGLGFGVSTRNGRRRISHSGSQQKAKTLMLYYPDDNVCFVLMSNSTYADVWKLGYAMEDAWRK